MSEVYQDFNESLTLSQKIEIVFGMASTHIILICQQLYSKCTIFSSNKDKQFIMLYRIISHQASKIHTSCHHCTEKKNLRNEMRNKATEGKEILIRK